MAYPTPSAERTVPVVDGPLSGRDWPIGWANTIEFVWADGWEDLTWGKDRAESDPVLVANGELKVGIYTLEQDGQLHFFGWRPFDEEEWASDGLGPDD